MKDGKSLYSKEELANGFHVTTSATLDQIDKISQQTRIFLLALAIPLHVVQDIELGIYEAMSNAIRHGACGKQEELIRFSLTYDHGQITISVIDPGPGFDWSTIIHSTRPILAESGRGLLILQNCFDEVQFNKLGNEITLRKRVLSTQGDTA